MSEIKQSSLAELMAFQTLFSDSFRVEMNMNDTFAPATADSEMFLCEHWEAVWPVVARYGLDALTAYAAVKRGVVPWKPYETERQARFECAVNEIRAMNLNFDD